MFAVIKTGGKQYKVAAENEITVMSLEGEAGAKVTFSEVLALFDGETSHARRAVRRRRQRRRRNRRADARPQGLRVQEAPPQEFQAQARPQAGSDDRQDRRDFTRAPEARRNLDVSRRGFPRRMESTISGVKSR